MVENKLVQQLISKEHDELNKEWSIGGKRNIKAALSYLRASNDSVAKGGNGIETKKQEAAVLKRFISDNGLWYKRGNEKYYISGSESDVYKTTDNHVIKITKLFQFASWDDYLINLLIHNLFCRSTRYELIGFYENKDGELCSVVRQVFIISPNSYNRNRLAKTLLSDGFINIYENDYQSSLMGLIVKDLHDKNVYFTDNNIYFIDTVWLYTKDRLPDNFKLEDIKRLDTMNNGGILDTQKEKAMDKSKIVTKQDLQTILHTMNFYQRGEGFMAFDDSGKFRFFDYEPSFGGAFVTKEDVEKFIDDYDIKMADGGTISERVEQRLLDAESNRKIKDVGRVAQSKKERAAYRIISADNIDEINQDEITAFNVVKKDAVWPPIDIEQQKTNGVTAGACFIKVKIREALPTKPDNDNRKRKAYVHFLNIMQSDLLPLKTVDEVWNACQRYISLDVRDAIGMYFDSDFFKVDEAKRQEIQDGFTSKYRFISKESFSRKLIEEVFGKTFLNILKRGSDAAAENWAKAELYEPNEGEKEQEAYNSILNQRQAHYNKRKDELDQISKMSTKELYDFVSKRYKVVSFTRFSNPQELFSNDAYWKKNYERWTKEAKDKLDLPIEVPARYKKRGNDWSWAEKDKRDDGDKKERGRQINKKTPLTYIKRVGGYKTPESTVENVVNLYGFSAYNFGKYVPDDERAEHAKHFIGAITDMAEILNIDIKQVHQLVGLGFGVGLKGYGGHLAAYFSQTKDINLVRGKGDGSVAHEWGHFFDNMLADMSEKKALPLFASDRQAKNPEIALLFNEFEKICKVGIAGAVNYKKKMMFAVDGAYDKIKILGTIDESLSELFKENKYIEYYTPKDRFWIDLQAKHIGYVIYQHGLKYYHVPLKLQSSVFYRDSIDVSAGNTKYWTSLIEMFARAFETYLYNKLADRNMFNNYLCDGGYNMEGEPYPRGDEYKVIESIIDEIVLKFKSVYNIGDFKPIINTRIGEEIIELDKKPESIKPANEIQYQNKGVKAKAEPEQKETVDTPSEIDNQEQLTLENETALKLLELEFGDDDNKMMSGGNISLPQSDYDNLVPLEVLIENLKINPYYKGYSIIDAKIHYKIVDIFRRLLSKEKLSKYKFTVRAQDIKNILYKHGNDSNKKPGEKGYGQISITIDDFKQIPYILNHPNKIIESDHFSDDSKIAIVYIRKWNGVYFCVEEVLVQDKFINVVTLYKKKV